MGTLLPISLADLANASLLLSPDEIGFESIAEILGFKIQGLARENYNTEVEPLFKTAVGSNKNINANTDNDKVNGQDDTLSESKDWEFQGEPFRSLYVKTLKLPISKNEIPPIIQNSTPLPPEGFVLPRPRKLHPLLQSHQKRAFVSDILAQDLPSTEIDCDFIINQLARGLIPELRFIHKKSIRNCVHVLIDDSPAMQLFHSDSRDLQQSIKNIIGQNTLTTFSFKGLPDRGVESESGEYFESYPFPNVDTTVLLVTDLGVGKPFGYWNVSIKEWSVYLRRLSKSGIRVIIVSPYGQDRLPELRQKDFMLYHWGTAHTYRTKVSVRDFARLLSPAAFLDRSLIREARIKFFPKAYVGLEADLLFNLMVAVCNPRIVSFRQETVRELREEIKDKPKELSKALRFLSEYRRDYQSERLAVEEKLIADALHGSEESCVMAIARLIHSLIHYDDNQKLARWAISVCNELPIYLSEMLLCRQLRLAAELRLGIGSEGLDKFDRGISWMSKLLGVSKTTRSYIKASGSDFTWLLPKEIKLGIKSKNGNIVITDSLQETDYNISVPATVPRYLMVKAKRGSQTLVSVWPGQVDVILSSILPFDIFTLSGTQYRIINAKLHRVKKKKIKNDLFKKCIEYTIADEVKSQGLYPFFVSIVDIDGPIVSVGVRKIVMAGSNNYLGLTSDPRVKAASINAINKYGTSCSGSRYMTGTVNLHIELEEKLADYFEKERCLLFSTGYQTGQGIIPTLVQRGEYIVSDRDNHASLVAASVMAMGGGANQVRYNHNNMEDLERVLQKIPENAGRLIVSDGVFSVSGEIVDLPKLVELAKKYNARIVIDDAHAVGVIGKGGRGTPSEFDLVNDVDLIMGTFSKTFGSLGGYVVGDRSVINYIKHNAASLIFSASPTPASVAAVLATLDILRSEPDLMTRLIANTDYVRQGLLKAGFSLMPSRTAIVTVLISDQMKTLVFWKKLFDAGVYVQAFIRPGVMPGYEALRASFMATHMREHLDKVIMEFCTIGKELGII